MENSTTKIQREVLILSETTHMKRF